MALQIIAGEVYKAERVRSGSSSRGDWELIVVKEDGKKREITVWSTNIGSGVTEGGEFRVKSIDSVKYSARKDNEGKWRDDISIGATVEPVGFGECPFDIDDPPFMMDDNPFDTDELPL